MVFILDWRGGLHDKEEERLRAEALAHMFPTSHNLCLNDIFHVVSLPYRALAQAEKDRPCDIGMSFVNVLSTRVERGYQPSIGGHRPWLFPNRYQTTSRRV
jgi:hypothetical protein